MNELIELLEMQQDLDNLIHEAAGELTINEFQMLQEAGIFNEASKAKIIAKAAAKLGRKAGTATGVLKLTPAERVQMINSRTKLLSKSGIPIFKDQAQLKRAARFDLKNQKDAIKKVESVTRPVAAIGSALAVRKGVKLAARLAKKTR